MRTWTAIAVIVALAAGCGNDDGGTATASAGGSSGTTGGGSTGGSTGASTAEPTTGATAETTGSTGTTDASTGGGTTDASTSGGSTGEACIRCAAALMGDEGTPCPDSKVLYDAIFACICGMACADVCEGACTMGQDPDMTCQTCQNDAFSGACMPQVAACFMDA